jgi:DNA-binding beta-propeller fold protein YncE
MRIAMTRTRWSFAAFSLMFLSASQMALAQAAGTVNLYAITKSVALGSPDRWDYLIYDASSHRVYATHSTSIDVLDGRSGTLIGKVDVPGANGVAVVPELGKGYAGSRTNKSVIVFDLAKLQVLKSLPAGEDTDAVVYDPASKRVFVMEGGPHKALVVDTTTDTVNGEIALGGQPEFAAVDGAGALFVNIEDQRAIQRVDTRTLKIEATWPIAECDSPHGLAIDVASKRLFSTCINEKMLIVDATSGKVIKTLPISKGSDASAFDSRRKRAFSSNGSGSLTVVRADGADKFELLGENPTQLLARTMAVDAETGRVYLLAGDRIEIDPNATNPRKRYGVAPGSVRLLFLDPVH